MQRGLKTASSFLDHALSSLPLGLFIAKRNHEHSCNEHAIFVQGMDMNVIYRKENCIPLPGHPCLSPTKQFLFH